MTLLILAAGMGSRYGGLKQIDPITDNGEFIIDFSVYDAILSGFDKVVFVIKEENLELFRETIGKRFEGRIKVEYAFQRMEDIPEGYSVPIGREKPWGTTQAVLCAKDHINEPFAVINADDFYGRSAFRLLAKHFETATEGEYCMVGYILKNTLTENGTVARGVCTVKDGRLAGINEMTKIKRDGDIAACETENGKVTFPLDSIVSMNCWGFTPDVFGKLEEEFRQFYADNVHNPLKSEFYLPFAVQKQKDDGVCDVRVYPTTSMWYGVTYAEDKARVKAAINAMTEAGEYPADLWAD